MAAPPLRICEYPDAGHLDPAWDQLGRPGQVVASAAFLRAYEASQIADISLRYLGFYAAQRLVAGAVLSRADFALDLLAPKPLRQVTGQVRRWWPRFGYLRSLTCGVWASQGGNEVLMGPGAPRETVVERLVERAEQVASATAANVVVFKEYRQGERDTWDRLTTRGYVRLHSLPFATMEMRWRTFDDYLAALRSGYRRQARANLAKRALPGVRLELDASIEQHAERFAQLYLQVMDHTEFQIETLNSTFFSWLGRELGAALRFIALWRGQELLGGALLALGGRCATFLYAGFDYQHLRQYHTYHNLLLALVEVAIQEGVTTLDFGQLSPHAKTRMGARLVEVFAYARGRGVPLQPVVRHLGHRLYPPRPLPQRHVFR